MNHTPDMRVIGIPLRFPTQIYLLRHFQNVPFCDKIEEENIKRLSSIRNFLIVIFFILSDVPKLPADLSYENIRTTF